MTSTSKAPYSLPYPRINVLHIAAIGVLLQRDTLVRLMRLYILSSVLHTTWFVFDLACEDCYPFLCFTAVFLFQFSFRPRFPWDAVLRLLDKTLSRVTTMKE